MLRGMNLSWPSEIPPWMSSQWGLFSGLLFCAFLGLLYHKKLFYFIYCSVF